MPGVGFTSASPFQGLPEGLWRNTTLDPRLAAARALVAEEQAKEAKLEVAIHEGRGYGVMQRHYEAIRRESLRSVLRQAPNTEKPW